MDIKREHVLLSFVAIISIFLLFQFFDFLVNESKTSNEVRITTTIKMIFEKTIKLPEPKYKSNTSIEEAILKRRSIRSYSDEPLSIEEISQLLWAAQGITGKDEFMRAAPSAGATYPLETYLVVGKVKNLKAGIYHYKPEEHSIEKILERDVRKELAIAALGQSFIADAPISIIFTAIYERTTQRYGERGVMYVHMEVGHAAQNVYLECESLNLGTVVVGAFNNDEVKELLELSKKEEPLYIMPIGRKI